MRRRFGRRSRRPIGRSRRRAGRSRTRRISRYGSSRGGVRL